VRLFGIACKELSVCMPCSMLSAAASPSKSTV